MQMKRILVKGQASVCSLYDFEGELEEAIALLERIKIDYPYNDIHLHIDNEDTDLYITYTRPETDDEFRHRQKQETKRKLRKKKLKDKIIKEREQQELLLTEAVNKAIQEPTLNEALSWICVWENQRAVEQARKNEQWDTCFEYCINAVTEAYNRKEKSK
jgi:hypothetical protein